MSAAVGHQINMTSTSATTIVCRPRLRRRCQGSSLESLGAASIVGVRCWSVSVAVAGIGDPSQGANPSISGPIVFCFLVMHFCYLRRRFRLSFAFGVHRPSVVEDPSRHGASSFGGSSQVGITIRAVSGRVGGVLRRRMVLNSAPLVKQLGEKWRRTCVGRPRLALGSMN